MIVNMESIEVFGPKHGSRCFIIPSPNNLFPLPARERSCFPLSSLPTKPPKFVRLKATTTTMDCDDQESNRPFEKLPPSPWTDHFRSIYVDFSEMDALRKEIDVLKTKVKNTLMFSQEINSTKKRILIIHLLVSLGLAHHFEEEIYETLKEGLEKQEMMADEDDLHTVSTIFCFFRRYGHYISSDVFRRFKGNNGNFKESLKDDAKGMLSLYQAAHLRTTTDCILDEALTFTSSHLESVDACGGTFPPHLSMRIKNAIAISQRWNMEIVAAMEYISTYEQEKDHDKMLLTFGKLNFKLVQLHYLQDIKILTKWYKEVDFPSKLPPYFKDRIVENNFFILAVFSEPQASHARIMLTKIFVLIGILDDTFDRYATLPEAVSLANSLERWAPIHAIDEQPDYLKFLLNFILDTFDEFERELKLEGEPYYVKATIEEFKKMAKAHCDMEKWVEVAHVPSFEEYMEVGKVDAGVYVALAGIFMCMGHMTTKEDYELLRSRPELFQSISNKCRIINDIYGFEDDLRRGSVTNAVNCYMKQYKVTKQEAVKELHKMVVDADKTINEELLKTIGLSRLVAKAAMGMAQMITICYNGYEGFTRPEGKTKEYMTLMLVDQICL